VSFFYVLHTKFQDGISIPKWEPRARLGKFLVFSLEHSSLIGLTHNLLTNHISPQFHLIYDEKFSTVPATLQDASTFNDLFQLVLSSTDLGDSTILEDFHFDLDDNHDTDNQFIIPIPSEFLDQLPPPPTIPPVLTSDHSPSPSVTNDIPVLSDIESLHEDSYHLPSDNDAANRFD
jgi:hypothetical protein